MFNQLVQVFVLFLDIVTGAEVNQADLASGPVKFTRIQAAPDILLAVGVNSLKLFVGNGVSAEGFEVKLNLVDDKEELLGVAKINKLVFKLGHFRRIS